MNALTWKAVFASLNPSPVFEAIAMFGEALAINDNESCSNELDGADSAVPKRKACERLPAREAHSSSRRSATWSASRPTRIGTNRNAQSVRM